MDSLDLEENSIMSRVIQAVGLFGDILSLEDTMEPIWSNEGEEEGPQQADDITAEEEEKWREEVMVEEDKERQVGQEGGGQLVEDWKDESESKEGLEEEREQGEEVQQGLTDVKTERGNVGGVRKEVVGEEKEVQGGCTQEEREGEQEDKKATIMEKEKEVEDEKNREGNEEEEEKEQDEEMQKGEEEKVFDGNVKTERENLGGVREEGVGEVQGGCIQEEREGEKEVSIPQIGRAHV